MNLPKAWNAKLGAGSFFAIKKPIQEVCYKLKRNGHCAQHRLLALKCKCLFMFQHCFLLKTFHHENNWRILVYYPQFTGKVRCSTLMYINSKVRPIVKFPRQDIFGQKSKEFFRTCNVLSFNCTRSRTSYRYGLDTPHWSLKIWNQ